MKSLFTFVCFTIGLVPGALACQICIPLPKKSAADYLIEADAVVLAREDAERPFHYAATEVLKGEPGEAKIELFLDSATRRMLAAYPDRSIVLAKLAGAGGEEATWKRIGTADAEVGPVVREVLKRADRWKEVPEARRAYFAKRLGHGNDQLRTLAHLEIAGAPYGEIRKCSGLVSREELRAFLDNPRYVEWHPLYILLLAQSGNPADHATIAKSFESAARFRSTLRLAAWATALIEIEEEEAVAAIEARYFRNAARTAEELRAVWQALSVHGSGGHVHLRDRIVAAYGVLLEHHPSLAPEVVRDLSAWNRSELAEPVARIAAGASPGIGLTTRLRLRAYVRKAKEAVSRRGVSSSVPGGE